MAGAPAVQPIVTPEAVVLDFERAGVASRSIAFLLDVLALVVVVGVLLLVIFNTAGDEVDGTAGALIALLTSLGAVIVWFCGFETLWRGRTLGKAAMGLRVVGLDGSSLRFQQAFLRAAMGLFDFFLPPIGFTAVVSVLLSPRDQRLGDMAAGTLVIRERTASADVAAAQFRPPWGWESYAASLDVAALGEDEYSVIRNYLLRAPQLGFGASEHLAVRIGNPVAVKIGHTPALNVHPHAFLQCVAARWQLTHAPRGVDMADYGAPPSYGPPPTYGGPPSYGPSGGYGQRPDYGRPPPDWSTPTPPGGSYPPPPQQAPPAPRPAPPRFPPPQAPSPPGDPTDAPR